MIVVDVTWFVIRLFLRDSCNSPISVGFIKDIQYTVNLNAQSHHNQPSLSMSVPTLATFANDDKDVLSLFFPIYQVFFYCVFIKI